ncbi:glycosyltransferase [Novosphingobium resinovorum]
MSNAISRHIPNPNRYNFLPRVRDKSGALTWGYFGRIEPDKGFVSDLFEAADRIHRHSGARWIVAGKGSMQDALTSFARTRPWVDFRGLLPEDQMAQAFDAIDVLALPSLWPENFPGILVQALGNGVPAVGFDIGGIPEVIDHGKTGIVAPFKDFQALSDAILSLDADRDRLKNMSIAALDAANRYDADKLEGQLLELVTQVVSRQDFSALP